MKTLSALLFLPFLMLVTACGDSSDDITSIASQVSGVTNSVSVNVLNMAGEPLDEAFVIFNASTVEQQEEGGSVHTFAGLANGDYSVTVSASNYDRRTVWMDPVYKTVKDGVTYGMLSFKNVRMMPTNCTLSFTKESVRNNPSTINSFALLEMDMTVIVPAAGVTEDEALLFTPFYGRDGIDADFSTESNEEVYGGVWVHYADGSDNRSGAVLPKGDTIYFSIPERLKPYVSLRQLDKNGVWMLPDVYSSETDVVKLIVSEPAYYAVFFSLEKEETMTGQTPLVFSPVSKSGPSVTRVHEFSYRYNDDYSISLTSMSETEDVACKTWLKNFITRQHAAEMTSERTGYVRTTAMLSAGMTLKPLGWQQQKSVTYKAFGWKAVVEESGHVYVGTQLSVR